MKHLWIMLATAMAVTGCGKHEATAPTPAPMPVSADLGKDKNYFTGLYGAPAAQDKVANYSFPLPGVGRLINLTQPFTLQKYTNGNLNVTVLFPESSERAVWVKYSMMNPWTDEQLKAALGAYDQQWSEFTANSGVSAVGETLLKAIAPAQAATAYETKSGVMAYKLLNDVMVYSGGLVGDIRGQIAADEQKKNAVPKF